MVITDAAKEFRREGLGYVYEPVGPSGDLLGVSIKLDSLHKRGEYVTGEMLVETTLPGVASHLVQTQQNISGADSRVKLAKLLTARTGTLPIDWGNLIEGFCVAVLRAEREGAPFLRIGRRGVDLPPERLDAVQYLIQAGRINEIHGPGGDGKGWLATFVCAAFQAGVPMGPLRVPMQGNVLYLDWEDDWETLERRLTAASRGLGIDPVEIDYRQCVGPLRDQVLQIARHVSAHQVALLVTDSVELACGVTNGQGTYEERAHGLHEALRAITTSVDWPVSVLLIDHVSEEARRNEKGVSKAYGTIFKMNWVRNSWELRKDQEPGSPVATLGLFPFKANHRPTLPPIGLKLDFSRWPDAVSVGRTEVKDSSVLSNRLTNGDRILAVLGSEPLAAADIAEEAGLSADIARTELNRLLKRGMTVKTDQGRWAKKMTRLPGKAGGSSPDEPPGTIPF